MQTRPSTRSPSQEARVRASIPLLRSPFLALCCISCAVLRPTCLRCSLSQESLVLSQIVSLLSVFDQPLQSRVVTALQRRTLGSSQAAQAGPSAFSWPSSPALLLPLSPSCG